jgi:hypothetical protein
MVWVGKIFMGIRGTWVILRRTFSTVTRTVILSFALVATAHAAQTNLAVTVRHAPNLNGSTLIDGSLQQLLGENVTLSGEVNLTGDLLVPGTPTLNIRGQPTFDGTIIGDGTAAPTAYRVTLDGDCSLRNLRTRTTPVSLLVVNGSVLTFT